MKNEVIEKEFINPRHAKRIYTARWIIEIPEGEPYVIVQPIKESINPRHRKRIYTAKWVIEIPEGEPYVIVRPRQENRLTPHDLLLYATIDALRDDIDAYKADKVKYPGITELNINLNVGPRRIDLITMKSGELQYWEIKTPRELGEDRTRRQLLDYLQYLTSLNLVTSEDGQETARQIIKLFNLQDKINLYVVKPRLGAKNSKSQLIKVEIQTRKKGP